MASAGSMLEDAFSCLLTATNPNDPQAAANREKAIRFVNEALSAPTAGRDVFAVLTRAGSLQIRFQCLSALQQVVARLAEQAMGDLQAMLHAARAALDRGEFPAQAPDPAPNSPQAELEAIHSLLWPWVDSNLDHIVGAPPFFVNKVAVVLAMLFKFLYPSRWQSAPLDALGFVQRGEAGVVMFLRLLYHVDDEIIRSHVGPGSQSLQLHAALLKDSMRVQCVGELAQAWHTILATYVQSRPDIVVQCLRTMQLFVHWIDVRLVANDTFVPLFHRLLASPSAPVRGRTCNCLARLVGKGMDKGSKLALIQALKLPQAVEPLGAEAARRATGASPSPAPDDSSPSVGTGEDDETGAWDSETAAEVWLAQLVAQIGAELHDVGTADACDAQTQARALTLFRRTTLGVAMDLARSPRPAVTSNVSEVLVLLAGLAKRAPQAMEATARAIAESGAQTVVDAAESPPDLEARVEATVHSDGAGGEDAAATPSLRPSTQWLVEAYVRLLSALVRMIRYPPEYRFEDGLVDANEDFERMRGTAVRSLHNAVQACPTGALAFAAQLFRTRELAPESLAQRPARVVEGALQFVAQAGQRVDLKPYVGKDQPFGMAVAALIGSSAAYHPAPAVAKAYFQTLNANFNAVLAAPELLPPLLQQLVGETGLRHPSRLVRHRCAFIVKETVRKATKVVGPHVNPLLQSIAPLLKIPDPVAMGENVEARAYRPADLLMLFQTVGLVAGNTTVEMESRKAALGIAGSPLRDQLTAAAQEAGRILSGCADLATQARIGAWIAQAIDCAFYVIKGIAHMAPELGGDISALLDASLQAAGAMPQHSEVRQKITNLMLNVTPRGPADVMAPRLPAVVQFLASTSSKPFLLQEPLTLMQQALSHQDERVHASLAPSISSLLPQALALDLPPPGEDEGEGWNARAESAKLGCGLIGHAVQSGASPHVFAAVGAAELERLLDLVYRRALQGPDSVARAAIQTFSGLVVAYLADARSVNSLPLPSNVKRPTPPQAPEQLRNLLLERVSSYGATLGLEMLSQAWFEPQQPPCVIAARDGAVLLHLGRRCFPAKLAAALESRVFPSMGLPPHVAREVMTHVGSDEPRALSKYLVDVGQGGLPTVSLSHGSARCTVNLHGATLTSWRVRGEELLFVSEEAVFNGKKAIRGGIPLVFPQFGPGSLPSHGFARTSTWELAQSSAEAGRTRAVFELRDSDATRNVWPHAFRLQYIVSLSEESLDTRLSVANTGDAPFEFQALLHTYHRTAAIESAGVAGLKGCTFVDKLRDLASEREDRDVVRFESEVDRIYRQAPRELGVEGKGGRMAVEIQFGESADGAVQSEEACDVVLWNPWVDKSAAMGDFGDSEWKHMLCVEPGFVSTWRRLAAGQEVMLRQVLRASL